MTRAFKILSFQIAVLAAGGVMMTTVATMTHAAAPPAAAVQIDNFTFEAPTLTVRPGTTVTWTNQDDIPHTVVANDKSFKSRVLDSDERFAFTFTRPGEYAYFCSLHPHMVGKVIVRPA